MTLLQYSVLQFRSDVRRDFQFLIDDFGFEESASEWTSHTRDISAHEHVASAIPSIDYDASMRHVSIIHDPRGAVEILVRRYFPREESLSVEEIARRGGDPAPEKYREMYDMTRETAGSRLTIMAEGLKRYGREWLTEPEAP